MLQSQPRHLRSRGNPSPGNVSGCFPSTVLLSHEQADYGFFLRRSSYFVLFFFFKETGGAHPGQSWRRANSCSPGCVGGAARSFKPLCKGCSSCCKWLLREPSPRFALCGTEATHVSYLFLKPDFLFFLELVSKSHELVSKMQ